MIQALQYRVNGLTGLASALATTASEKTRQQGRAAAHRADAAPAGERRDLGRLVQGPVRRGAQRQGVTGTNDAGGPLVPDSTVLQTDELASTTAMTSVLQRLSGAASAGAPAARAAPASTSTKVEPSGDRADARPSRTWSSPRPTWPSRSPSATPANRRCSAIAGHADDRAVEARQPIVKTTKIDFINPGESTTVTFKDIADAARSARRRRSRSR